MGVKVLVVYDSRTGNTEKMAKLVAEGVGEAGAQALVKRVDDAKVEDLADADAVIIGSPTYFGLPSAKLKKFLDDSLKVRGKLENKVGAAFSSSAHPAGGRETTILAILQAMLVHGMVVCGDPLRAGGHYGAAATGSPDNRAVRECKALGHRVARLAQALKGFKEER